MSHEGAAEGGAGVAATFGASAEAPASGCAGAVGWARVVCAGDERGGDTQVRRLGSEGCGVSARPAMSARSWRG